MIQEITPAGNSKSNSIWCRMFGIDLRTLAVFRMGIAAVLCGDLLERLIRVRFYYTDSGLLPKQAIDQLLGSSIKWTSLHYHTGGSVWLQSAMIIAGILLAIALFAGYRTKLATILSWILFISLNRRVSSLCTGGDDLMRLMLVWSIFLPLGARWSMDARRSAQGFGASNESNRFCSAGTCAILLQLSYVYLFTAIIKFAGPTWLDGSAVQHALQFEVHVRPVGLWLSEQSSFLFFLTYATLFVEFAIPVLVFSPFMNWLARWIAIITMFSLHIGIFVCLTIGTFPFVCMACWLLFVPTETWDWLRKKRLGRDDATTTKPARFPFEQSDAVATVVITLLIFVTTFNVLGLEQLNRRGIGIPKSMKSVAKLIRMDQKWKMYAPHPASTDGWFLMPCLLSDGATYDVFCDKPVSYEKPAVLSANFPTARIKKMFLNNRARRDSPLWLWVVKYYTDRWNVRHPDRPVVRAQLTFIGEETHDARPFAFPYVDYDVVNGTFALLEPKNLIGIGVTQQPN